MPPRVDSFANTADGLLLVADGVSPMQRWDGLTGLFEPAGIIAPASAPLLGSSGGGAIVGTYAAYVRYEDRFGNFSDLSPVSATFSPVGATGAITAATDATPIVITSAGHGLNTGAVVKITGVGGNGGANDSFPITVLDANTFSLDGSSGTGAYNGGGEWVSGVAQITYTGVPAPTQGKVSRLQILRNTDGQATTFYVDVDSPLVNAGTFTSTQDDAQLQTNTAVPLLASDGSPLANRFGVPPAHKRALAVHQGRVFAGAEVIYADGVAVVTLNSPTVRGVGTAWTASMVGRNFYPARGTQPYPIQAVDVANQTLTLTGNYLNASDNFARYAIRPAPAEARLVYYTEAALAEAWPAINTISVQANGDEITGLAVHASFLYVLERRHVHRFTVQTDPAVDGYVFTGSESRGCINNRCWVSVEGRLLMLDEQGIHGFDGSEESDPVSLPVQDVFRTKEGPYQINWKASEYFHAVHFPAQETVRWFVALSGHYLPRHALTFNYRLKRWWIEEYTRPVGSSVLAHVQGALVPVLGSSAGQALALWAQQLDGADASLGTVYGTVASAGLLSLTDASAAFDASAVGSPLTITDGRGKGQTRTVLAVSGGTARIDRPWLVRPDATSVYQLGGVNYRLRTRWFRWAASETQSERRLELIFEPTTHPALLNMNVTEDVSTDPVVWPTAYTSDEGNGVRTDGGSADLVVDLTKASGFVQKRLDNHQETYVDGARFIFVELYGTGNDQDLVLDQLTIDGVTA